MKMKLAALLAGSSVLAMASPALAQDDDDNAIVVTGTIIRGVAPAGANVVGFSEEDVQASGASNLNELMATLPQASGNLYGSLGQGVQGNINAFVTLPRISLRDLPGSNLGGGMQTLILVDGHRLISGGIAQVGVDSRIVSPMLVERVEVITDGGSAIYGSDAIAGVINYITRSEYDGVEATGRMTFGQNGYEAWNGSVAGGTAWDSGSVFAAYDYSTRDALFGRDFDYIRDYGRNPADLSPLPTGTQCDTPTVEEGGATYSTSGTPLSLLETRCDLTGRSGRVSAEYSHNFNAGFTQELSESLTFDVRGLYADRATVSRSSPYGFTATVPSGNPNYETAGALGGGGDQTVRFNFSPVFDNGVNKAITELVAWQISPSLTWDVGNDWQIRGLVSYGESETTVRNTDLVAARVNDAVTAGTVNPYDIASSTGDLSSLLGTNVQRGWNTLENYRLIADGPLFELPGGMIRTAIGAEYMSNDFSRQLTTTSDPTYPLGTRASYEQTVESVFGQLSVPIFGAGNRFFLMESLLVQFSARYDNYNDFGSTVNPMIGVTYEPTDWLTFRGNWGESFQAASPTDILGITATPNVTFVSPGNGTLADGTTNTGYIVSVSGSTVEPVEPQTTTNWSVGFDLRPPMIPGLTLSASYYHIELNGRISNVSNGSSNALIDTVFPNLYLDATELQNPVTGINFFRSITGTQLDTYGLATEAEPNIIEALVDNRRRNIGNNLIEGIDFSARYFHDTDWGSWDASFSGTFKLTDDEQASSAAPWVNKLAVRDPTLANTGQQNERLRLTASFGVSVDNFRAQATLNRQDGRDNAYYVTGTGASQVAATPPANAIYQSDVDPYLTMDLFFRYNLDDSGWGDWTNDTSLTLNIDNVTNEEPDIVQTGTRNLAGTESSGGYGLFGLNLGRTFTIGISKRF